MPPVSAGSKPCFLTIPCSRATTSVRRSSRPPSTIRSMNSASVRSSFTKLSATRSNPGRDRMSSSQSQVSSFAIGERLASAISTGSDSTVPTAGSFCSARCSSHMRSYESRVSSRSPSLRRTAMLSGLLPPCSVHQLQAAPHVGVARRSTRAATDRCRAAARRRRSRGRAPRIERSEPARRQPQSRSACRFGAGAAGARAQSRKGGKIR